MDFGSTLLKWSFDSMNFDFNLENINLHTHSFQIQSVLKKVRERNLPGHGSG